MPSCAVYTSFAVIYGYKHTPDESSDEDGRKLKNDFKTDEKRVNTDEKDARNVSKMRPTVQMN
jgi:hypothetical protein